MADVKNSRGNKSETRIYEVSYRGARSNNGRDVESE